MKKIPTLIFNTNDEEEGEGGWEEAMSIPPDVALPSTIETFLKNLENPKCLQFILDLPCSYANLPLDSWYVIILSLRVINNSCQDFGRCLQSLRQHSAIQGISKLARQGMGTTPSRWDLYAVASRCRWESNTHLRRARRQNVELLSPIHPLGERCSLKCYGRGLQTTISPSI